MPLQIEIKQIPAQPLAVVRRRAAISELPKVIPQACGIAWTLAKKTNVKNPGRNVAYYLDNVMNIEVGIECDGLFTPVEELVPSALPAGKVAMTTHFGPYHLLGQVHDAVRKWCADNHLTLVGPAWEIYGHWQKAWEADPTQIRTDVFYLLQ